MKLVVVNKLSDEKIAALKDAVPGSIVEAYKSPREALPHVSDADALSLWGFQNVEPFLQAGPNIRWVHSLSDGVEKLLTPSMMERPIILTNSHGIHDRSVSEHTLALLLAWYRRIPDAVRHQNAHEWIRPKGISLFGKTILIVGFGGIGRAIAQRAKVFETRILAVKKHLSDEMFADHVYTQEEIMDVLPKADIIIAALPSTPETEKFFDAEKFRAMKKSALFINIARASVVDEPSLIEALQNGTIAGACMDVFSKEPLPPDHPFWSMENVIMTPHIASMVPDFWDKLTKLLETNYVAFAHGEKLLNEVDKKKGY
ncbi:D-2-hydroxyacid dehydrogenase [Dialister sp.]|uniref:D-2-hydroxyacid dehydrogenase n=1 Tax=Dialister sp. TaxID=1955814 RepID=UPI002E8123E3|nr:D-2-hydroxyacid dehydrogenase [Dialister sp.]MEE3452956.1 D-2-hydroxyacid dehydrogenase [Dialister sp.]